MKLPGFPFIITALFSILIPSHAATSKPPWNEILGPSRGTIPPAPSFKVNWRPDLQAAIKEAKEAKRPALCHPPLPKRTAN